MSSESYAVLQAFEHLPPNEKRSLVAEILRRSLAFDSGPLADDEISSASAFLFDSLNEEDAGPAVRSGWLTLLSPAKPGPR